MKRRLTQFCFALCLVFTLAASVLWAWSFWTSPSVQLERGAVDVHGNFDQAINFGVSTRQFMVFACAGNAERGAGTTGPQFDVTYDADRPAPFLLMEGRGPVWHRLGFWFVYESGNVPSFILHAALPAWFIVLACAGVTGATGWPLWRARQRRLAAGMRLCLACGYDLRGAEHERCPECGAVVVHAAAV